MANSSSRRTTAGWFVTATDAGVGKTIVAGALARLCREAGKRVGVFKPIAVGCRRDVRLGMVSGDAEYLAHCAESPDDLATINPVRYTQELVPMVAADRSRRPVDHDVIRACYDRIADHSNVIVVEAVGGLLTPLDAKTTNADLAVSFGLPVLVVAPAGYEAVNHVLLTLEAARARDVCVDGVILNRYDSMQATLAEETNPDAIARLARVPLPIVVPFDERVDATKGVIAESILFPLRPLVRRLMTGCETG